MDRLDGAGRDRRRARWAGIEQVAHAGRPVPLIGVADLQLDPPARRPEAVAGDADARALPDHVAPEIDPALALQLEAHAGRLGERGPEREGQIGWLQDDEPGFSQPRPGGQTPQEPLPRRCQPCGQVDHEQVDGSPAQERAGELQALARVDRPEDEEPGEVDSARDGLQGVEGAPQVEVGRDRAAPLGLRHEPQGERRLPARRSPPERHARRAHEPASQDRVEGGEAGRNQLGVGRGFLCGEEDRRQGTLEGDRRPHRAAAPETDRGPPPAVFETGEGGGQGLGGGLHRPTHDRTDVLSVKMELDDSAHDGPLVRGLGGRLDRRPRGA